MEPVSLLFGILTLGIAHFGGSAEMRYQADCFGTLSWYKCNQAEFGNIHTPAYLHALHVGHNPHARTVKGVKYDIK
jgi:hypothetical protein